MREMRKYYVICMWNVIWMAYTSIWFVEATYEALSRNPLDGSPQIWPLPGIQWKKRGGGIYGNEELTRLLDVGARTSEDDPAISFVPPLDRASPDETLWQDRFAVQFVLFDLQLVELKSVDPVGGSFKAEIQMVLHWIETIRTGSTGTDYTDDCRFPCDTKSTTPRCCDEVWVPPLHLPSCDINKIQSSLPQPYIYQWVGNDFLSVLNCSKPENIGKCTWRRLWYLSIDATCASNMDFHDFPFDVQHLTIDILNPHASRTWFQLTKGFLKANIGEYINTIDLSPDAKIPGWYVKNFEVSGSCGTSKNWGQTFLTQDNLLEELDDTYVSQKDNITKALDSEDLTCSIMEDFNASSGDIDFSSPTSYTLYQNVSKNYEKIVNTTLETYKQCTKEQGGAFYWKSSSYEYGQKPIPNFGIFPSSSENIKRSFNILDLVKQDTVVNVSFPCAISAVAKLTTPGIQVTIVVQRYRVFYVVKLVLPIVACVAFSFAAFGLHPKELIGRLTVVVPSAIALTALQGLVVSTDLPPVAYIAPSTYIFLFSYLVQILISFESILVNCLYSQSEFMRKRGCKLRLRRQRTLGVSNGMIEMSKRPFEILNGKAETRSMNTSQDTQTACDFSNDQESGARTDGEPNPREKKEVQSDVGFCKGDHSRVLDLILMAIFVFLYIVAILYCTIHPKENSKRHTSNTHDVHLWP